MPFSIFCDRKWHD